MVYVKLIAVLFIFNSTVLAEEKSRFLLKILKFLSLKKVRRFTGHIVPYAMVKI